jgi:hypothetical protein
LTVWINGARRTVLEASLLIVSTRNEAVSITIVPRRSPGYKYLIRSPLGTISHSFSSSLLRLGFHSLVLCFPTMEGKRGIKRELFPSVKGSHTISDGKTPPLAPSGTPSSPESLTKVSSHRPCSPMLEQGGPSRMALVIDLSLSSDEEDFIANTSHDFEFIQQLYGELNRDLLGPSSDGKVIIPSDSDKKKRRHARRSLPASKMRLHLLQSTRSQPPPPTTYAFQLRSL